MLSGADEMMKKMDTPDADAAIPRAHSLGIGNVRCRRTGPLWRAGTNAYLDIATDG